MKKLKWHRGPPPFVGWWMSSLDRCADYWRWWDGEKWSIAAHRLQGEKLAAELAAAPTIYQSLVEWCDYWPEGARVPRLAPSLADGLRLALHNPALREKLRESIEKNNVLMVRYRGKP